MLESYKAGAKYIAVFNYPYYGGAYGTLTDDQFKAIQRFWNEITTKQIADLSGPDAALVLPKNFGWGLRNPNDTIWGFWLTDNRTQTVAVITSKLVSYYGINLDIVYEDPAFPVTSGNYQHSILLELNNPLKPPTNPDMGWKCLIKSLSHCWYGRNKI